MSDLRRAALLLAHARSETPAEKGAFAAQKLACQLYAGNHDMVIVGLCGLLAEEAADATQDLASPDDLELPIVEPSDVDVVLAVIPDAGDGSRAQFDASLEHLRAIKATVVMVDRTAR